MSPLSKQRKPRNIILGASLVFVILACSSVQINMYDTPSPAPAAPTLALPTLPAPTLPPPSTLLPTVPIQPIPGLEGHWQQGARVFTVAWQDGQYVVTSYKVAGSPNSQILRQSWDGTTLTWTSRSHPENNAVTYVVQSVNADKLFCIWTVEAGGTGHVYLRRAPSPDPAYEPLPFFDDFSDPTTGWEEYQDEHGVLKYEDGYYSMRTKMEDWYAGGLAFRYYDDVVISLDVTSARGPNNNDYGFGLGCNYQINGEGYWFEILMSGYYYVGMWTENSEKYVNLLPGDDWRASNAIRTGRATNHVVVTCANGWLNLEVNGETLFQGTDDTYSDGDILLSAISYDEMPVEIRVDNISVTAP